MSCEGPQVSMHFLWKFIIAMETLHSESVAHIQYLKFDWIYSDSVKSVHVNKNWIMEKKKSKWMTVTMCFTLNQDHRLGANCPGIHVNSASLFLAVYSALWEEEDQRKKREQTFTSAYSGFSDILKHTWENRIHIHIECRLKADVFPETTISKPVERLCILNSYR